MGGVSRFPQKKKEVKINKKYNFSSP